MLGSLPGRCRLGFGVCEGSSRHRRRSLGGRQLRDGLGESLPSFVFICPSQLELSRCGGPACLCGFRRLRTPPGFIRETPEAIKEASRSALLRLNITNPTALDPAQLFFDLAEKFYYEKASVQPEKGLKEAYIWSYTNEGLVDKVMPEIGRAHV